MTMSLRFVALLALLWCSQAVKIAVVSNGDFNDFGWTNTATTGLRDMERILKIHGSILVPNILEDTALATMQGLINEGYDMIFALSGVHSEAMKILVPLYPNVYFVFYGANLPANGTNFCSIQFPLQQQTYLLGFLSALQTTTGKVGLLTPGTMYRGIGTANTFFIGMQRGNASVQLYHIMIDTYLDPDRSTGASEILLSYGVDVISQQQDDLTVPLFAMNHGMLAHGTTGVSLASLFGENVATSVLRNWTNAFVNLVGTVLNGTWKKQSIAASFANGMLKFDSFSYLIPDTTVAALMQEEKLLVGGNRTIFCGEFASFFFPPASGNCLSSAQISNISTYLPGITGLGTYVVPLEQIPFPDAFVVGLAVAASLLLAMTVVAGVAVVVLKNDQHIWSSSPIFCVVVIIGAILNCISVLLRLPTPTEELCHATIWTVALGYSVMLSPLVIKNFRIWRIFDNPKLEVRTVTNATLFGMSALVWLGTILLLAIWSGIGDIGIDESPGQDGLGTYEYRTVCTQNWDGDSLWITLLIYHGVLLFIGCFISYKIRTVQLEVFNESKNIALCIYNITFCLCVIIPIIIAITDQVPRITLFCISVLFSTATTMGIMFMPKFWGIIINGYSIHPILTSQRSVNMASTAPTNSVDSSRI